MLVKLQNAILFPLMMLMMAVAFYVPWGAYEYVLGAADETSRMTGGSQYAVGYHRTSCHGFCIRNTFSATSTFGVSMP